MRILPTNAPLSMVLISFPTKSMKVAGVVNTNEEEGMCEMASSLRDKKFSLGNADEMFLGMLAKRGL